MPEISPPDRVEFANTLRGVAALCVLIQHYFVGFWSVPQTIGSLLNVPALSGGVPPGLGWIAPPFPLAWGAFGVALFFLVSGFVIPFSLAKLSAPGFLLGRLFRIFPVYAVGFTISLLSLWWVGGYFSTSRELNLARVVLHYLPGLRDISGTPDLDGVVWTLDIEVKFYLVCALAAPLFRTLDPRVLILPLAVALGSAASSALLAGLPPESDAAALASVLSNDLAHIVFMFIGTVFYFLHIGRIRVRTALLSILALASAYAILLLIGPNPGEVLNACNYALAILVFAAARAIPSVLGAARITGFFASISYPLYAVHAVFGWAVLRVLSDQGVPAWLSLSIASALAIGLAWLLHVAVETPAHRLGRRLSRQIGQPVPVPAI